MTQKVLEVHNLPPLPRVLPTLGEIPLDNWQCFAELIDNAIDGFRTQISGWSKPENLEVDIYLSAKGNNGKPEVVVVDNGPGMAVDSLCNAARAGYTSRTDRNAGYLGLYGMGLNVAMARLGERTEIWTKRGSTPPSALVVDLKEMVRLEKFAMPRISVDPTQTNWHIAKSCSHFTAVRVVELSNNAKALFDEPENANELRRQLGEAYSPILTHGIPVPLILRVDGIPVKGHRHNVWRIHDAQKEAMVMINQTTPNGHHIHGWIGIQRFSDHKDYGIDFIWNGRKIESRNKELFSCIVDGVSPLEYPIDTPRKGGRIVGEIHLDHCLVPFTKTEFYREDPAWGEMIQIVRGGFHSPMRPNIAKDRKLPKNESPLAKLYSRFRRNDAHDTTNAEDWKALLAFPDNEHAKKLAKRVRPLTDDQWLVELDKDVQKTVKKNQRVTPPPPAPSPPSPPTPTPPAPSPPSPLTPTPPAPISRQQAGARAHLAGLPSNSALVQDPFIKAVLAEIDSSLDEKKSPIAFSLAIRAVLEIALLRALEKQSPQIWKEIKDKNMGINRIIENLSGRLSRKEKIFEDPSLNEAVRGFVERGMSDNIGKFLNNVAHGHALADKESAKALVDRATILLHRLLGPQQK